MRRDFENLNGADPWQLLGVPRDASPKQLQQAFRPLAKRYHPDSPTGDTARFKGISLAYEILSSPERAAAYAARLRQAAEPDPEPEEYTDPYSWESGSGPAFTEPAPEPEPPWTQGFIPEPPQWHYAPHGPAPAVVPPWPYPPPPPPPPWNGFAIASLVLTLTLCVPVGFPLAIVALTQIPRTGQRGAALAWTALALSALAVVLLCCAPTLTTLQSPAPGQAR